jgi:hypothetical protein
VLAYLLGFSLAGKLDKNVYTSNNIPFPRDYSGYEEIDRISGKTAEYILENYVKMGKPVVITDGTKGSSSLVGVTAFCAAIARSSCGLLANTTL